MHNLIVFFVFFFIWLKTKMCCLVLQLHIPRRNQRFMWRQCDVCSPVDVLWMKPFEPLCKITVVSSCDKAPLSYSLFPIKWNERISQLPFLTVQIKPLLSLTALFTQLCFEYNADISNLVRTVSDAYRHIWLLQTMIGSLAPAQTRGLQGQSQSRLGTNIRLSWSDQWSALDSHVNTPKTHSGSTTYG